MLESLLLTSFWLLDIGDFSLALLIYTGLATLTILMALLSPFQLCYIRLTLPLNSYSSVMQRISALACPYFQT